MIGKSNPELSISQILTFIENAHIIFYFLEDYVTFSLFCAWTTDLQNSYFEKY